MIHEVRTHLTPLGTRERTQAALKAAVAIPLVSTFPLSTYDRKNMRDAC